ncbi:Ribosomal RNA-processing protein 7 A [Thelohanellus kitauei]|uniref:Ribosomal RNA-processing protein 7 A n=1 Tax=Thelohanellus kitauei TaxID=669202 RepID=A0A0C2JGG3_THEKT|nr:Ribosomal RNA-processing protein 7 A [Thelohanellus kitauei]
MIKNFRCIGIKFAEDEKSPFYVYFKNHNVDNENRLGLINGRTLFVTNIPSFLSDTQLSYVFNKLARVEKLIRWGTQQDLAFASYCPELYPYKSRCQKYAYIVFNEAFDPKHLSKFLQDSPIKLYEKLSNFEVELEKPMPAVGVLLEVLNKYQLNESETEDVDEEGWVKVKQHSKLPQLPFQVREEPKKKEDDVHLEIYSFKRKMIQEEKMLNLRRKLEEDKARVTDMKRRRVFKPLL